MRHYEIQEYSDYGYSLVYANICKHNMTPIQAGDYTIYCSGYSGWQWAERKQFPDLGVYLDDLWMGVSAGVTVAGNLKAPRPVYDTIMLDWDDYGAANTADLAWTVRIILNYLHAGKRVEIGCFGGHGRTGTLLAILIAKIEHLSAYQAILEARKRYCQQIIESRQQMEQVFAFTGQKPKGKHYNKLGFRPVLSRQIFLPLEENPDGADISVDAANEVWKEVEEWELETKGGQQKYANIGGITHVWLNGEELYLPINESSLINGEWVRRGQNNEEEETWKIGNVKK